MHRNNYKYVLLFLNIGVFVYTIFLSAQNGWHQQWGGASSRNIPAAAIAISELKYGLTGYRGYSKVVRTIKEVLFGPKKDRHKKSKEIADALEDPVRLNQAIRKAANLKGAYFGRKFISGREDTGLVSYYKLAFSIFGYKIESLFYLYYSLLGISLILFIVAFHKQIKLLFFSLLFLCSHLLVVRAAPLVGAQLQNVFCSRFLPVLGILPALYLALLIWGKYEFTLENRIFACIQTYILTLTIHTRSSAIYQIMFLFTVASLAILNDWKKSRGEKFVINKYRVWPVALVLVFFFVLKFHHTFALHKSYTEASGKHMFWHPVYLGLSGNPDSLKKYGINFFFDESASDWVKKQAGKRKITFEFHETVLKKRFLTILKEDPWFVIKSYLYKPLIFIKSYFSSSPIIPQSKIHAFNAARLLLNWPILLIIGVVSIMIREIGLEFFQTFGLLVLELFFSLLPTMLFLPIPHLIADPALVFTFLLYLSLSGILSYLFSRLFHPNNSGIITHQE